MTLNAHITSYAEVVAGVNHDMQRAHNQYAEVVADTERAHNQYTEVVAGVKHDTLDLRKLAACTYIAGLAPVG
jgi:hypothetical protein